ncbi:hypothetical protein P3S67_006573 [Capsicum chacoense]
MDKKKSSRHAFFPNKVDCVILTEKWTVGPYDRRAQSCFLVLGGVNGNPGRKTIKNWFEIEVFGENYKIRYCPSVCWNCKVVCKDVGLIEYNGQKRLGLSDFPVEVKFVKDA